MRNYRYRKWIKLIIITVIITSCSLAGAKEGIAMAQATRAIGGNEAREESKVLRAEVQTLQNEVKKQAVQVKQLSRTVEQLNSQLQRQLNQVQKNKIKLSAQEVQLLREHLQLVRVSSQRLADGEQRDKQAQQQWKQHQGTPYSLASKNALEAVKTAQAQKIKELTSLKGELQQLTSLLVGKGR